MKNGQKGGDVGFIGLDKDGIEHPDPRPIEVPTRLKMPQRQVDRVREIIRQEFSRRAMEDGKESFEEADDFDIPGEEPFSPYEEVFEPLGMNGGERDVDSKANPEGGKQHVEGSTPPSVAKPALKGDDPPDVA